MDSQLKQLSESYSNYLKVDTSPGVKAIGDSIEETLTRLEEFETILLMMRSSAEGQLTTAILDKKEEFAKICEKIRYLEEIVFRVRQEVDAMEILVNNAEAELNVSSQGKLQSLLKPLLFMRPDQGSSSSSQKVLQFTPHNVLNVNQFFLDES